VPIKVSPKGSYRFNRTFSRGKGREPLRITRASGVMGAEGVTKFENEPKKIQNEFRYRDGLLTRLYEQGDFETLQRFQDGEIQIQEIISFDKQGRLRQIGQELVSARPLWKTWEEAIPNMRTDTGKPISSETRRNYTSSMKRLKSLGIPGLGEDCDISALRYVDWARAYDAWEDSPAAWNHIGRGLSRFLTVVLGDKFHPIRREVVRRFPKMTEFARVSSLTRIQFYRILDMLPEKWRPYFVTLAVTGLRIGELCALNQEDLDQEPHTISVAGVDVTVYGIRVKDSKTPSGVRTVYVAETYWPYVVASVPVPVTHWYLRDHWNAAVDRAGMRDVRVHDLRHFAAQLLSDEGVPEAAIQALLGHADPSMTRMYSMTTAKKETAAAMAGIFPVLGNLTDEERRKLMIREVQ
jgi:integrase